MSDYERCKLQQFVDIITADGIPRTALLLEVAEIIGRMLLFDQQHHNVPASKELLKAAQNYGLDLPHPPRSVKAYSVTQALLSAEIEKSKKRIKQ